MNLPHTALNDPLLLAPLAIFILVFALSATLAQRPSLVSQRLSKHRTAADGSLLFPTSPSVTSWRARLPRFIVPERWKVLFNSEKKNQATRLLLSRAGQPMSLEAYGRLRYLVAFLLTPLLGVLALFAMPEMSLKLAALAIVVIAVPRLPAIWLKRRAKQRAKEMDSVMADVLDLLVVCVEAGQSLSSALAQVANRTENVAAEEFRRLMSDINSGMARRDAFLALADRCQSESLAIVCTTIVQADKIGMGIARTLRTLSDTMRTRRRQAAETKARQAPIKMMPVLVGFMLPTMLALLLGPVILEVIEAFN